MGVSFVKKCSYFAVPNQPYDSAAMSGLSFAAQALWAFFNHVAHRVSSFRIVVFERDVEAKIGMSANTQRKAREEMDAANLIRCQAHGWGASCVVHLVNPESGELFPANSKPAVYGSGATRKKAGPVLSQRADLQPTPSLAMPAERPLLTQTAPASVPPPSSPAIQEPSWRCFCCKGSVSYQREDGFRICAACHPKSAEAARAGAVGISKVSRTIDSAMNEDGLPGLFDV